MKQNYLSRKENIILTAIDIIDELGINGLSTREIAKRQNISDAALYKHFKSKEEVILEVLKYYASYDLAIEETVKNNKIDSIEGIVFFLSSFTEYYEGYPQISAITISYQSFMYDAAIANEVKKIIDGRLNFIKGLIIEGQKKGKIIEKYNPEDLADMIVGTTRRITCRWRLSNYSFSLKERVLSAIMILLESVKQ